ncbi:MAG TPA: efflux RND transporter periplasmic adaptor subunit [Burkholderiaceae bacterium]|nr:efflux RND transporter periplasmic adaptor subunit [Burkholderiaceae bacterium]
MTTQATPENSANPGRRSGRARLAGSVIAVAVMAALGGLAWYLTHPAGGAGGAGASPGMVGGPGGAGGPGGPGGAAGPGGRRGGPATTVGVATAEKADVPVSLDALGTVTSAATTTVRVQVSGILRQVLFKEGQMVKAGQVLAEIDPRQFEMALLQASGQRQRDEAQLENAKLTLERYRTLLGQDSIARQDVDTQAALVKQLQGTVMTDRAAEGLARLNLGYTKVTAPISGRVGLRGVDVGNLVNSGDAAGIAVITQLSPIDVTFTIPQDQAPDVLARVHEGAALPAIAFDRTRSTALAEGKFAALDNQVDTQTGTVKAKARFANDKATLFPSQFVNLRLELRTIKDAVMVPVTALRHGANGDFVYVLNADRTVSLRPVTRGQATADKVQMTKGLQAGEQVITEGADRLKDGARVVLAGDKPGAGAGGAGGRHGGRRMGGTGAAGAGADGAHAGANAGASAGAGASATASGWAGGQRPPRGSGQ